MRKEIYPLLIVCLFALTLRLYPTLISGMPFSTDAWPLIRNTELLIQNTPVNLNNAIFDAYNNFWPGIQLFGAVLSQITGLTPITAMSIGIPIVSTLTILIFYLLVKKLTTNTKTAIIAALLLAAAFSYTLYSAGVTKEAFASPIYMTLILLFIIKHNKKTMALFSITSLTLALTHHLTVFFATITIITLTIAFYTVKSNDKKINTNKSNLIFTLIQLTLTALYFIFFSSPTFNSAFTLNTLLTVAAYEILAVTVTIALIHITKNSSKTKSIFLFILGSLASIYLTITMLNTCTLPGAHMLYALPLIIGLPTALYGLIKFKEKTLSLATPFFWLLATTGFMYFTVFSNMPGGSIFSWRAMNFILPPLIILIAAGAYKLYTTPKQHIKTHKFAKTLATLVILLIVTLNSYGMYQTVTAQDPALGYFWLYHPSEYNAANWIAINANNQTTAGDAKPKYLIYEYFNKTVSDSAGLSYLAGSGSPPEILYIYNQMVEEGKGYVLGGVPINLPENWTNKLSNYNLVYANSEVTIYARR